MMKIDDFGVGPIMGPGRGGSLRRCQKGGRIWPKARLRDRIDAIIAHGWAESQHVDHRAALKEAARPELPVTDGASLDFHGAGLD